MMIYPAIDLLEGACVRLYKGDFAHVQSYSTDPLAQAQRFAEEGATWLHLVDLSGAKNPADRQTDIIRTVIDGTALKVQTGGGVRGREDVERLLAAGAARVVIGSLAVKDPQETKAILQDYGADAICLALDVMAQNGVYYAATSGWQETSALTLDILLDDYQQAGAQHILCTDISRDGTLTGPHVELYAYLARQYPALRVQASGGVSALGDLAALRDSGTDGVIIGKALYEGRFTVREALAAC